MGVRVSGVDGACLFDSVTGLAFGPVFDDETEARAFLERLAEIDGRDPRIIPAHELAQLAYEYRGEDA